ncbi:MAG: hypothetical protein GKC03_01985 [Methanomassiliicoccales archaeon]|nr:hypothetical protein [Methanomassiliicoccales archaeon]NYT15130.1 hypothetical protein [Methanomassiliicoccales archaeon]
MAKTDIKDAALLFVYNGNLGALNAVKDHLHKLTITATYECRVCGLTYGNLGMKNEWKEILDGLEIKVVFLHRDEFKESYTKINFELPAAFIKSGKRLTLLISANEINASQTLQDPMEFVRSRMEG